MSTTSKTSQNPFQNAQRNSILSLIRRSLEIRVPVSAVVLFLAVFLCVRQQLEHHEQEPYLLSGAVRGLSSKDTSYSSTSETKGLLSVRQMKEQMVLPCNYIHDGYYRRDSNEVLNQVYQSWMELDDNAIPVIVECGGHDGITKSQTLKASRCLHMNTLLIEASPTNYKTLSQARKYDFTVNAALCDGDSVQLYENQDNSGESSISETQARGLAGTNEGVVAVTAKCTSIDHELDKLKSTMPLSQRDKLILLFLVLDVEGHESYAIDGIQKYAPTKAFLELKSQTPANQQKIEQWAHQHHLVGNMCSNEDMCYNFHPLIGEDLEAQPHLKTLLYGARSKVPVHHFQTSKVSPAYMFYGE